MMMLEEIKLRTITTVPDASGFPSESVATKTVYADKKSVRQSEFYAADAAGKRVDIVFVVNPEEWGGQTQLEHDGKIYTIVRTYQAGNGRVELTCAKL